MATRYDREYRFEQIFRRETSEIRKMQWKLVVWSTSLTLPQKMPGVYSGVYSGPFGWDRWSAWLGGLDGLLH